MYLLQKRTLPLPQSWFNLNNRKRNKSLIGIHQVGFADMDKIICLATAFKRMQFPCKFIEIVITSRICMENFSYLRQPYYHPMFTHPFGTSFYFKEQFKTALQYLKDHHVGEAICGLEQSRLVYTVAEAKTGRDNTFNIKTRTITWSPKDGLFNRETGLVLSPATVLNHELGHAHNYDQAVKNPEKSKQFLREIKIDRTNPYNSKEEERVITGIEQKTALALGEIKAGEVTRKSYSGIFLPVEGVTSNRLKDDVNLQKINPKMRNYFK